jgi:multiple sugar transport system permease protein
MSRTSVAPKAVVKASKKKRTTVGAISSNALLIFIAIVLLIPALWMTIAPSKDRAELVTMSPLGFGTFESYITRWQNLLLYDEGAMLRWIENSIWYTSATVILSTTMALLGGFALAAINIKFKRQILILIMIAMIIPTISLVMPTFVWLNVLGLTDTELGLILASSLYPFGVYLSYIHFSTVIPRELYEAAKIDGCGYFKIFRKVALPVSKSLAGIVAFFSFLGAWNSFFLPQVFILSGEKHPLSSGLVILFTNVKAFCGCEPTLLPIFRSEIALSALILITPTIFLFIFAQRFLSRGMLAGSVKS